MKGEAEILEHALGHRFARPGLLGLALTHSSASHDGRSNQRLEFLGDRVLGLVVAQALYERFPDEEEGALAPRLAALVRRDALARVARDIGLGGHVVMSQGEEVAGGRDNPSILADACEAVIAALYLDGGMEPAQRFIRRHWLALMEEDTAPPKDSKTELQEWAQGRGLALPDYTETGRRGPAHAPVFSVRVSVQGADPAAATGPSKRAAEQAAAAALLDRIKGDK